MVIKLRSPGGPFGRAGVNRFPGALNVAANVFNVNFVVRWVWYENEQFFNECIIVVQRTGHTMDVSWF